MSRFLLFFILFTTFSALSAPTRKETVTELAKQANRILPWNWFIVHTDTSLTVYFCRTSLNKAVGETGVFIENQDLYGDQFWGAPIPDSIFIPSRDRTSAWNKGSKPATTKKKDNTPKLNGLLRIDIHIGANLDEKSNSSFYDYFITVEGSIPDQEEFYFEEKTTPESPYYGENGVRLIHEYQGLLLSLKFLFGIPNAG